MRVLLLLLAAALCSCRSSGDGAGGGTCRVPSWANARKGIECGYQGWAKDVFDKGTGIEMILVPPGTFWEGATDDDEDANRRPGDESSEVPRRMVAITRPFYLGKYEVTQGQWAAVMKQNPSRSSTEHDPRLPVEQVSWDQVSMFLKATGFRFPTEAEWEYACRAGTTGVRYGNLDDIAWYHDDDNSVPELPHPVGTKMPNSFGLYDMLGNVYEYCSDLAGPYKVPGGVLKDPTGPKAGPGRIVRGGSFWTGEYACRASYRFWLGEAVDDQSDVGFRVARNP